MKDVINTADHYSLGKLTMHRKICDRSKMILRTSALKTAITTTATLLQILKLKRLILLRLNSVDR